MTHPNDSRSDEQQSPPDAGALDELLRRASQSEGLISLAGGFPAAEAMPASSLSQAAQAVLSKGGQSQALQYGWPEGRRALREWVAQRLRKRGAKVEPDDVIITSGAQQALSLAADRLLQEGSAVRVPALCYAGALSLFRGRGARLVGADEAAQCAYVMPGVENPVGSDPVHEQAEELRALDLPIIADEAYGELRFDGRPPTLLLSEQARVFHVGSFSKTVSPGLRVGWLIAPRGQRPEVIEEKQESDLQASSLTQSLLVQWLQTTDYDAHVARINRLYAARADALMEALRRRFPSFRFRPPEGGFCLWVETGEQHSELALLRAAVEQGVSYDPGSLFRATPDDSAPLCLRLCFSNCSEAQLEEAVGRLGKAWDATRSAS